MKFLLSFIASAINYFFKQKEVVEKTDNNVIRRRCTDPFGTTYFASTIPISRK